MKRLIQKFLKDESGASMIEYVLIAAVISIAALSVMGNASGAINAVWTRVVNALGGGSGGSGGAGGAG